MGFARMGGMIVLASQSPRRAELMRNAGIPFRIRAANIPEILLPDETPEAYVQRLARQKALTVHAMCSPDDFVLGADTTVVVAGRVLEKPTSEEDAAEMLRALSGREHLVMTGVCLVGRNGPEVFEDVQVEVTSVRFAALSEEEIREYVATGEPMDKAGAYAIQGIASRWIAGLSGCYFNVVGLPVPRVYRMLHRHGAL